MPQPLAHRDDGPTRGPALSQREVQVLQLAQLGHTNATIAERLGVSAHTVKFHLASSYRKLGAVNRTDAIVRWLTVTASPRAGTPEDTP